MNSVEITNIKSASKGSYSGNYCERLNSQCDKHEDCARCIYSAAHNTTKELGKCYEGPTIKSFFQNHPRIARQILKPIQ